MTGIEATHPKKEPLFCRLFGHRWAMKKGFYTIGEIVDYHCDRRNCGAKAQGVFWVDRSVL
jgi:hypothetical protein